MFTIFEDDIEELIPDGRNRMNRVTEEMEGTQGTTGTGLLYWKFGYMWGWAGVGGRVRNKRIRVCKGKETSEGEIHQYWMKVALDGYWRVFSRLLILSELEFRKVACQWCGACYVYTTQSLVLTRLLVQFYWINAVFNAEASLGAGTPVERLLWLTAQRRTWMRLAAVEIKIKDQTVRGFEGASLTTDSTVCYGRGGRKKVRKIKFQGFEPAWFWYH